MQWCAFRPWRRRPSQAVAIQSPTAAVALERHGEDRVDDLVEVVALGGSMCAAGRIRVVDPHRLVHARAVRGSFCR